MNIPRKLNGRKSMFDFLRVIETLNLCSDLTFYWLYKNPSRFNDFIENFMKSNQIKRNFKWDINKLHEVDKSLYMFLQTAYELKLISIQAFGHATTVETNLLIPIEDI